MVRVGEHDVEADPALRQQPVIERQQVAALEAVVERVGTAGRLTRPVMGDRHGSPERVEPVDDPRRDQRAIGDDGEAGNRRKGSAGATLLIEDCPLPLARTL